MELIIIGGVVAVVVVIGLVFALTRRNQDIIDERLERFEAVDDLDFLNEPANGGGESSAPAQSVSVLDESRRLLDPLNNYLADRQSGQNMRKKLSRANLKLTVAEYAAAHVLAAAVLFTGAFLLTSNPIGAVMLGFIGFFVPRIYVGRLINKRLNNFETQLPDTLGLFVNALRSGYSVLQAMEAIAQDSPEPTMTEFSRVVREVQLGIDLPDALNHLLNRIESEDLDLVVTAINIQREVGGNLAEILEVISHTIRERIKLKGEVRVLTSQGRITGYLISGMPVFLLVFLNFISPDYIGPMFSDQLCGWPLLGAGAALIGIGTAVIQKIVDIEI